MTLLLREIRRNPLLWLSAFVPVVLGTQILKPEAHTLLFVLSIAAIVPLATLLSIATEAVAAKTGDTLGGLLNATLGNLTELLIALAALHAGQYVLVKASIAGAIVTKWRPVGWDRGRDRGRDRGGDRPTSNPHVSRNGRGRAVCRA